MPTTAEVDIEDVNFHATHDAEIASAEIASTVQTRSPGSDNGRSIIAVGLCASNASSTSLRGIGTSWRPASVDRRLRQHLYAYVIFQFRENNELLKERLQRGSGANVLSVKPLSLAVSIRWRRK